MRVLLYAFLSIISLFFSSLLFLSILQISFITSEQEYSMNMGCSLRDHVIAIYFYVWYDGHWDHPSVIDQPIIGYYSSTNTDVLRWQLEKIKEAGIDVLFVYWWGPGSYEDRAAKLVFSLLKEYGLKGVILIEPFKGGSLLNALVSYGPRFWREVLNYIDKNFIEPYRDVYFTICGKPLVLAFAPVGLLYLPKDPNHIIRVIAVYTDILRSLGLKAHWDL